MRDTLVMILAGGKGSRLGPLTVHRSKPGVPFAGRYRIMQSQRGLLLATVLRASTNVVIRTIPYRLTTR